MGIIVPGSTPLLPVQSKLLDYFLIIQCRLYSQKVQKMKITWLKYHGSHQRGPALHSTEEVWGDQPCID